MSKPTNADLAENKIEVSRFSSLIQLYDLSLTYYNLTVFNGVRMFPDQPNQKKLIKDLQVLQQTFRAHSLSFPELALDVIDPGSDNNRSTLSNTVSLFQGQKGQSLPDAPAKVGKFSSSIQQTMQDPANSAGILRHDPPPAPAGNALSTVLQSYSAAMTNFIEGFNVVWALPSITDTVLKWWQQKHSATYVGLPPCNPPVQTAADKAQAKINQELATNQAAGIAKYQKKFGS